MKKVFNFLIRNSVVIFCLYPIVRAVFNSLSKPDFDIIEALRRFGELWLVAIPLIFLSLHAGFELYLFWSFPNKKFVAGKIATVERHYNRGFGQRPEYYAHVEYQVEGRNYNFKTIESSRFYRPGRAWQVVYNGNDPNQAMLCPHRSTYSHFWGFGILGIAIILCHLFLN